MKEENTILKNNNDSRFAILHNEELLNDEAIKDFVDNCDVSESTKVDILRKLQKNKDKYGLDFLRTNINIRLLENYLVDLTAKNHSRTYQNKQNLNFFLNFCYKNGYCRAVHLDLFEAMEVDKIWLLTEDKFFSGKNFFEPEDYKKFLHKIENYSLNPIQDKALFMTIYEGVFFGNFIPFNLIKASDITENELKVNVSDTEEYTFTLSDELKEVLIKASKTYTRNVLKGEVEYKRKTEGYEPDSCFKFGLHKEKTEPEQSIQTAYGKRIRPIFELLNLKMTAIDLYYIGVFHRADKYLQEKYHTTLKEACSDSTKYTPKFVDEAISKSLSPAYQLNKNYALVSRYKKLLKL